MSNEVSADPTFYVNLAYAFWGAVACFVIGYLLIQASKSWSRPRRVPVLKSVDELNVAVRTTQEKKLPSYESLSRKGRRTLPSLEFVDFNPKNKDHCRALQMLMQEPAQLHPTLRFHFDPATHDNAYAALLGMLAESHITRILRVPTPKATEPAIEPEPVQEASPSPVPSSPVFQLRPAQRNAS